MTEVYYTTTPNSKTEMEINKIKLSAYLIFTKPFNDYIARINKGKLFIMITELMQFQLINLM